MKKFVLSCAIAALVSAASAHAGTVFQYKVGNTQQGANVGQIEFLTITYDTDEFLSFSADIGPSNQAVPANGGWLALSDGPNPKSVDDQLALLYFDFAGGDIYAYKYDGRPGPTFGFRTFENPANFITSYEDVLTVTGDTSGMNVSFTDLDVSALAPGVFGPEWEGVSFDTTIGGWLHFNILDPFTVAGGLIAEFEPKSSSWFDFTNHKAVVVSEPGSLAVLGLLGAAGLVAYRRRRRNEV